MKRILIICITPLLLLAGCSKFLEVKPVGAKFLSDLEAVKSTMGAWLYNFNLNAQSGEMGEAPAPWITYSTGGRFNSFLDVWSFTEWDRQDNALSAGQKRTIDHADYGSDWSSYYELVGFMNLIITEGTTATGGDEQMRDIILGEAYIERAYYLLKLLQYYAPIDDPSVGIPLHTDIHASLEEADLSRQPQSVIFEQIIADLAEAETRIARTPSKPSFNIMYNKDWIYRVASQIYFWKANTALGEAEDWQQAVRYAELALKNPSESNNLMKPFGFEEASEKMFNYYYGFGQSGLLKNGYPEALALSSQWWNILTNNYTYSLDVWRDLYHDGDKRKTTWFLEENDYEKPSSQVQESDLEPSRKIKGDMYYYIFRLAEQWMIRIEGLAMTGKMEEANQALQEWRELRYTPKTIPTLTQPNTPEKMQQELYLERKREFLGEADILYLDMKRFKITDTRKVKDFSAELKSDDFRYQQPIPTSETDYNPQMIMNPGWSGLAY